jgi:hypothetical protein
LTSSVKILHNPLNFLGSCASSLATRSGLNWIASHERTFGSMEGVPRPAQARWCRTSSRAASRAVPVRHLRARIHQMRLRPRTADDELLARQRAWRIDSPVLACPRSVVLAELRVPVPNPGAYRWDEAAGRNETGGQLRLTGGCGCWLHERE